MFRFSGTSSLTLTHKKTREVVHNCYLKIWELFFPGHLSWRERVAFDAVFVSVMSLGRVIKVKWRDLLSWSVVIMFVLLEPMREWLWPHEAFRMFFPAKIARKRLHSRLKRKNEFHDGCVFNRVDFSYILRYRETSSCSSRFAQNISLIVSLPRVASFCASDVQIEKWREDLWRYSRSSGWF